ncbi:hypothetical protein EDC04DRAFT_2610649 [Pisolithus marmoratus]|nr:hypothetical protein EDC04DRAFT_2610649 [Pisolithus marmoratus]
MNVDDSWSDATSPTISKLSKPPIDAHAIIASTLGIAEKSVPHAIINRHTPATMQKATAENPCSEAAANTAVVIRSMESNLVDNPHPVAATNTTVVSSMGSNLGKCPAPVDTAQVDTPPLSDNAHKPFISSPLATNLFCRQMEMSSLHSWQKSMGDSKQQRAALKDLQAGFGMLQAKLDCEITRVNAEKEAQFAALMQKFKGTLHQVEVSRSQIQTQKEAEVVALAQKFEDALCQVEVSKSQIQVEKETEVAALAQKFEDALCQVKASKSQIQMEKETKVAALAPKFEGALHQVEVLNQSQQLSHSMQLTPCCKVNSRKYCQFAVVKNEIINDKEQNDNLASDLLALELFGNIFLVTRDEDFLSHESPSHEVVMSFTKGNRHGPDPINLQWDFTGPVSLLWNQAVIKILLDKREWTTKLRSDEYWKEAIKQKFNWIKVIWTKGRPKRLKTGILETPTQVAARLMHTKMDDLKTTWKDTQRVAKFHHHSTVTKSFLHTEMAQGTKDVELWQWLSNIIDHLGTRHEFR